MRMTANSYLKMNELIGKCFDTNARIDNLAYNLDYHYLNEIAKVVHQNIAHVAPEWADLVSNKMLELNARPVRYTIGGYIDEITSLKDIFSELSTALMSLRDLTKELIETADIDGDDEVRIFAEEFLTILSPYIKQADEWINVANILDEHTINIHIDQYTHNIAL